MRQITIPGPPVGKQRPRFAGAGRVYTPAKTVNYERRVAAEWQYMIHQVMSGPLSVDIDAYYQIPKSATKAARRRMEAGEEKPVKKPDLDNIVKAILDGLNGVAWHDDAQVCRIRADKRYTPDGMEPCVVVTVYEMEAQDGH